MDGEHYNFVTKESIEQGCQARLFLECQEVHKINKWCTGKFLFGTRLTAVQQVANRCAPRGV